MASPLPVPPPGFDQLSQVEQLEYVEELLDYVTSDAKYVEIPDWHREILEERMARFHAVGIEGSTWEEFEQELNNS